MKHILLLALLAGSANAAEPELRLELVRESLTGTHYRYREYSGGIATESYTTVTEARGARAQSLVQTAQPPAIVRVSGRVARRAVVEEQPGQPWLHLYDVETGALLRRVPHFYNAKPARVFDPNPIVATNNLALRDQNDAASAVPASAYTSVEIDGLRGPHVQIVDRQAPNIAPADDSAASLIFDRSQSGFEDVNAYFHIDRNQRYLQSLGYRASRQIAPYAIEVDTHAQNGADNSTFVPSATAAGRGVLFYGTGGTDDAEDADIVIHEYAHAIHEWISPGTFLGTYSSEARALSEGFGDYWAYSQHVDKRSSMLETVCFGDWDARCGAGSENCAYPPDAECLRRLDSNRTMADYERSDTGGVEHRNGGIWSRALISLFHANRAKYGREEGKRVTDTLVLEAMFGVPPNPTFAGMARRMVAADDVLFDGRDVQAIHEAMLPRGITIDAEPYSPQSDVLHVQSVERGLRIPDADPAGVVAQVRVGDQRTIRQIGVRVDVDHSARGDLRLVLTAPNGQTYLLQDVSFDRSPGIHATYGVDVTPLESLGNLVGLRAEGTWTLRVSDHRTLDVGTLRSWSLVLQTEGAAVDPPLLSERPLIIPTARKERAEIGLQLQTQLRLVNPGKRRLASVTYIPTGPTGSASAATVLVELDAGQAVVFDDVLAELFRTAGSGTLYVRGAAATSRTWADNGGGTVGMRVGAIDERTYFVPLPTTLMMQNPAGTPTARLGLVEVSGRTNAVRITIWAGDNSSQVHQETITLAAHEHRELPLPVMQDSLVIEVRGERAVIAYGIETNAKTGDLLYVRPTDLESVPAISAQGANGTYWRTEMTITRHDANLDRFWIPITFYNAVTGETMSTVVQDPELHQTLRFPDVVATLFERPGHFGRLDVGLTPGVVGSARMTSDGTHTALPGFQPAARSLRMLAVENNQQFRTNIGVYADIAGPVTIDIRDAAGQIVESRTIQAPEHRLITFRVTAPVTNGYAVATIERGAVRVYASVVDNYTGDSLMD